MDLHGTPDGVDGFISWHVGNEHEQVCRADVDAHLREKRCRLAPMMRLVIEEMQQDFAQQLLALDALG